MEPVKIDFSKIPPAELEKLCTGLCERIKMFYEDPENMCRYEKWQKERENS